jgi:hypothetical protein
MNCVLIRHRETKEVFSSPMTRSQCFSEVALSTMTFTSASQYFCLSFGKTECLKIL